MKILLIEDNAVLAGQILDDLGERGASVDYAATGKLGLQLALDDHFDVVVLDLTLPDMDGLQVCAELRSRLPRFVPVIMLTARDSLEDKAQGFASGSDDYLTKPFELTELFLRCQALTRRHRLHQDTCLRIGELSLDRARRKASRAGRELKLSTIGFTLLLELAEAWPQALTRSELIGRVWQDEPPESDALRSHIYSLRQQLDKPFTTPMLKTLHGVGFCLEVESELDAAGGKQA